ncbi:MAG: Rab family GTPase [Candidatus Asgardarchaeia archaeon]
MPRYVFKVVIVGDPFVGKTSLALRYTKNVFCEDYKGTIGVNFFYKNLNLGDRMIRLQIWDTGGQEVFSYIRPSYYKGASGAIVCYDITDYKTFLNVKMWVREVLKYCGYIPITLVGTKLDLSDMRNVRREEGVSLSKELNVGFFEVSSKLDINIDELFMDLVEKMYGSLSSRKNT